MNYVLKSSHRDNKNFSQKSLKIITGLFVILIIVHTLFPKALPSFFTVLVRPFWGDSSIEELRKVYAEEEANYSKNNALQKENEDLKNLLSRSFISHPLLATILKKPPFSAYDTFILDVGKNDNVKNGDKVYTLPNIPIGEIAEVIGNTSKVRLYSSSGEKFTISIGSANIQATAEGKGGGYFEASLPRDTKIAQGDTVLIPSLDDSFVGTVEVITSKPNEPFSKMLFRQPVNIYELRWVLVETDKNNQ